jgi:maltokinase
VPEADAKRLALQVASAEPATLLPASRKVSRLAGPFDLVGSAQLADGLVLAVIRDATGTLIAGPFVTGGDVRRAMPGDGAAPALAALLAQGGALGDELGDELGGEGFDVVSVDPGRLPGPAAVERPMLVDQTHESVVVGDDVVVKWAVHAEQTPAPMLVAHLSQAGFTQMPRAWGFVTWSDGAAEPVLVASAMQYLQGASDGWTWAVQDAGDHAARGGDLAASVEPMAEVGHLVADLHCAFATSTAANHDPVSHASVQDVEEWRLLGRQLLDDAIRAVDGEEGERLAHRRDAMAAAIDSVAQVAGCLTIPVHGDLHVGQVLRWVGGYAVGDFDGNPVLPVGARLRPQPAARDVAGMLQALDHVGRVVHRRVAGADPERVAHWISSAQERFIGAYRDRLREESRGDLLEDGLLLPFQVEQECREFLYAVHHLPRWRYVPDQALQALFP